MKLNSDPPTYYEQLADIGDVLKSGRTLSFIVPSEYKFRFRRQIHRIEKTFELYYKRTNVLKNIRYLAYFTYVECLSIILCWNQRELCDALKVYESSWQHISFVTGEDISKDKIRIIYKPKKYT